MKKTIFVSLSALVSLIALLFVMNSTGAPLGKLVIGKDAPGFELEAVGNKKVRLSDYRGKHVVLEWTNPGCPFVEGHYKSRNLPSLQKKYRDKGVVWLLINSTKTSHKDYLGKGDLKLVMDKWESSYDHILLDEKGVTGTLYSAKTTPHMYVINDKGKLVYQGAIDDNVSVDGGKEAKVNYVSKALDEILKGNKVKISATPPYGCSIKYEHKSKKKKS